MAISQDGHKAGDYLTGYNFMTFFFAAVVKETPLLLSKPIAHQGHFSLETGSKRISGKYIINSNSSNT